MGNGLHRFQHVYVVVRRVFFINTEKESFVSFPDRSRLRVRGHRVALIDWSSTGPLYIDDGLRR